MIKKFISSVLCLIIVLFISCVEDTEETVADTTPPTVSFSIEGVAPNNLDDIPVVGNSIEIEISAQDAKGISKVEAFLNDTKVGEDREAPFKISIDLSLFSKNLSGKGTSISSTLTQYTLKVSATDMFGNVSSKEKDILVDNEIPTITEVSLESNAVINGIENEITFKAQDNEEITSLEVKINETVLETTALDSITYSVNIDTSLFEEGMQTLSITASDEATNAVTYSAPFIIDKTGPEITLEGPSVQDSVIDENTIFSIIAEDLYADVDSLKVFINDSLVVRSFEPDLNFDFNPDDYPTGNTNLKISALDTLGNESTKEMSFETKRLLLKIDVPADFLDPSISQFYVFASDNSGDLLAIEQLDFNTTSIKLNTAIDVQSNTEYMLNFAFLYRGNAGESSYIKTIQNVKRSALDKIDLKTREHKNVSGENTYQVSEMPTGTSISGLGTYYGVNYHSESGLYIQDYHIDGTAGDSDKYYLFYHNTSNRNYAYQFVNRPLSTDFTLEYENFISENIETRFLNSSAIQDPDKFSTLALHGYLTASDFENDVTHLMWWQGYHNVMIMNAGYKYPIHTGFYNYRYILTLENYHIEAIGEPLEYYNAPDWSIDYVYSNSNKSFSLIKSGTSHTIGKIFMNAIDDSSGYNSHYSWTVLFDSQIANEVVLPKLPEELQVWNINNYYSTGDLDVEQIEVKKYDGLDTYDDFLINVIGKSGYKQHKVSDKIESVFKTNVGAYISRPDISYHY